MFAAVVTDPGRGGTLLARAADRVAQRGRCLVVRAPVGCQGDAIHVACTLGRDPAIGYVVRDARGFAVERVAKAAPTRREEDQDVAGRKNFACLRWQVLDGAGEVAVFERQAAGLELVPQASATQHAALRARFPATRISILNDVAAAAWHYRASGRFALVTVSTGVAFKVFDAALPADRKVTCSSGGLAGIAIPCHGKVTARLVRDKKGLSSDRRGRRARGRSTAH